MDSLLTADSAALHLFFNDDVYLVDEPGLQQPPPLATRPVPEVLSVQEPITFKFLGKNKRNILILVNDDQNEVSDEMGRELLRKIVKSVNLTANDFALLNYAGYSGAGFKQLMDSFSSKLVFAFGVTPAQLSLKDYPENTMVTEGTIKLIFSAELRKLDQDPAGKKALWGSLQNLGLS
jgi:DNA polymerase III psi subunit